MASLQDASGLKGGPAAWQDHAGAVMATLGLEDSRIGPHVACFKKRNLYLTQRTDDFLMIGPQNVLEGMCNEMKVQMLLRDIVFLEMPGDNNVQFLGWQLARMASGFDVSVNQHLARDFVEDAGPQQSSRQTALPGYKDRTNHETPCASVEHKYYRSEKPWLIACAAFRCKPCSSKLVRASLPRTGS